MPRIAPVKKMVRQPGVNDSLDDADSNAPISTRTLRGGFLHPRWRVQDAFGVLEELFASGRQRDAAGIALEQLDPEVALERQSSPKWRSESHRACRRRP